MNQAILQTVQGLVVSLEGRTYDSLEALTTDIDQSLKSTMSPEAITQYLNYALSTDQLWIPPQSNPSSFDVVTMISGQAAEKYSVHVSTDDGTVSVYASTGVIPLHALIGLRYRLYLMGYVQTY